MPRSVPWHLTVKGVLVGLFTPKEIEPTPVLTVQFVSARSPIGETVPPEAGFIKLSALLFSIAIVESTATRPKTVVSLASAVPSVSVPVPSFARVPWSMRSMTFLNAKPPGTESVAPEGIETTGMSCAVAVAVMEFASVAVAPVATASVASAERLMLDAVTPFASVSVAPSVTVIEAKAGVVVERTPLTPAPEMATASPAGT